MNGNPPSPTEALMMIWRRVQDSGKQMTRMLSGACDARHSTAGS
jgi:hypothetical protein